MSEKQAPPNLYQRLNKVMEEVTHVFKDKEIGYGRNTYKVVQHDDVTAAVRPSMVKHGIFLQVSKEVTEISTVEFANKQGEVRTEYMANVTILVDFVNVDNPEDRLSVRGSAIGFDSTDKCVGKACSMAVKNIILKNLMLESRDNEEEREVEQRGGQPTNGGQKYNNNRSQGGQNQNRQNNSQGGGKPQGQNQNANPPSTKQKNMIKSLILR